MTSTYARVAIALVPTVLLFALIVAAASMNEDVPERKFWNVFLLVLMATATPFIIVLVIDSMNALWRWAV